MKCRSMLAVAFLLLSSTFAIVDDTFFIITPDGSISNGCQLAPSVDPGGRPVGRILVTSR